MNADSYRRRRWTYSFRAWMDERGSNDDRGHARGFRCQFAPPCRHLRLWDLNRTSDGRNIIRIVRRRRPFALGIYLGKTMRLRAQIGLSK